MIKQSRREFVKKAAYIPPVILSLAAAPSYAKTGSHKEAERPGPVKDPHPMFPRLVSTPPGRGR